MFCFCSSWKINKVHFLFCSINLFYMILALLFSPPKNLDIQHGDRSQLSRSLVRSRSANLRLISRLHIFGPRYYSISVTADETISHSGYRAETDLLDVVSNVVYFLAVLISNNGIFSGPRVSTKHNSFLHTHTNTPHVLLNATNSCPDAQTSCSVTATMSCPQQFSKNNVTAHFNN